MQDENERFLYELREKGQRDYDSAIITAEKRGKLEGRIEGKLEGRIEGKLEGRKEGRREGRKEGKVEGKLEGKLEDARAMLAEGLSPELAAKITGLPLDALKALRGD